MIKKFLSMLVTLSLVLAMAACGQANTNNNTTTIVENTEVTAEAEITSEENASDDTLVTQYPVTVTDQAGREVTIESEPERLVSGYYISSSLLIALDLEEKLVGIEAKADKRPIYSLSAPQLIDLPNVGTAKEFDLEGCIALEPDLVILPMKLKNTAEALEKLNIDVLYVNPENQELLTEMMTLIGTATNTQDKTAQLMGFEEKYEATLTETLAGVEAPSVYLAGNSNMLSTAGSAMYQSSMITLAGGINVASDITDAYWVEIDYEQLLDWNPEYIILASDADYTVDDVLTDPNLAECLAVQNKNVYQMPNKAESWDSPVPSGILGSLWLATILHEDLFTTADAVASIDEYYETFYDFTYSEN